MRHRRRGDSAGARLALAVISASFSGPILRWGAGPPMVVAAGRMLLSFALALPPALALWRRGGAAALGIRRAVALPMVVATVMLALHFAAWTAGVYLSSVTSAVVMVNAHPLVVLAVEALLWRQPVRPRQWGGAVVALAGLVFVGGADAFARGGQAFAGDALAFAGAATYAVYVLSSARVRVSVPTSVQVAVLYGGSLVLLGLGVLLLGERWPSPWLAGRLWLSFVLMALIPTTLGHTMVQSILDRVRPGVVSVALLGEPVGASLLAWAFLHQTPSAGDIIGGALTLTGIALALWPEGELTTAPLAT